LKTRISPQDLEKSFRTTYTRYTQTYPNYGKGKLEGPREWWAALINDTFVDATGSRVLPSHLGSGLYTHFSSATAYKPYVDSLSFIKSMRALREQYSDPEGPLVCVGVVTNSDPRVRSVLESMGFQVGLSEYAGREKATLTKTDEGLPLIPPNLQPTSYDPDNDFDFLATSYDAASEKPDGGIWTYAKDLVGTIPPARATRALNILREPREYSMSDSMGQLVRQPLEARLDLARVEAERDRISAGQIRWVHIGDELKKDYLGAQNFGFEALHLRRQGEGGEGAYDPAGASGVHTISNLNEAAMVVNAMARSHFKANSAAGATNA